MNKVLNIKDKFVSTENKFIKIDCIEYFKFNQGLYIFTNNVEEIIIKIVTHGRWFKTYAKMVLTNGGYIPSETYENLFDFIKHINDSNIGFIYNIGCKTIKTSYQDFVIVSLLDLGFTNNIIGDIFVCKSVDFNIKFISYICNQIGYSYKNTLDVNFYECSQIYNEHFNNIKDDIVNQFKGSLYEF